jgi:hypothetical protein
MQVPLPVPYRHVVVAPPHTHSVLVFESKRLLYDQLYPPSIRGDARAGTRSEVPQSGAFNAHAIRLAASLLCLDPLSFGTTHIAEATARG